MIGQRLGKGAPGGVPALPAPRPVQTRPPPHSSRPPQQPQREWVSRDAPQERRHEPRTVARDTRRPAIPPARQALPRPARPEVKLPPTGAILVGEVCSYTSEPGFGFIKSPECEGADIYFNKNHLPPEAVNLPKQAIIGKQVEFELTISADGKPRTDSLTFLDPLPDPEEFPKDTPRGGKGGKDEPRKKAQAVEKPLNPLTAEQLEAMRQFLEERGGAYDHGKFSNYFPGVKKAQLEAEFVFVQETSAGAGGRWQILLPGAEPMTMEEREQKEILFEVADNKGKVDEPRDIPPPPLMPSASLLLMGHVKQWVGRRGHGFIECAGHEDIFLSRKELPAEFQNWRGNLEGVLMCFEVEAGETADRFRARNARIILEADPAGGFQMRRV